MTTEAARSVAVAPVAPGAVLFSPAAVVASCAGLCPSFAASMVGGVVAGPALGRAIEWSGIRAVPLLLCGVSALCLAATLWLIRATRTSPAPH